MGGLLKLAELLFAVRRITGGIGATARRASGAFACMMIALALAAAAVGCAVAALWIYALPLLGPVGAPLAVAGALLIAALVLLLVARRIVHAKPASAPLPGDAIAAAELALLMKEHKLEMLIAALTAGLVAGAGNRRK